MTHEASLSYSQPLVKRAALAFWRRKVGVALPLAFVVTVGAWLYTVVVARDSSWMAGATGAILLFCAVLVGAVFFSQYRSSLQRLREMRTPAAVFRAGDDGFELNSDIGSVKLAWTSVKEIWQFQEFWLLMFSKHQYNVIPTSNFTLEMKDFVVHKVTASGGKVG